MTETVTAEAPPVASRPRRTWSENRRRAERERRAAASGKPDLELVAEEVVAEAVANVTSAALMFLVPVAPHVGFTIAGVPHPDEPPDRPPERWVVASRAAMAGHALLEHARRNVRVLQAIDRFNGLFRNVELLEVAGAVVASVAVDAHLAPPDAVVLLPGGIKYPVFQPVIGDTLNFVRAQREAAQPQHDRVEPRARDNHQAHDEDPTLRREGQTVVEGGVQDT